jgi:colicin import membrane protein
MIESISQKVVIVAPLAEAVQLKVAAEKADIPKDELVITTPGQMKTQALIEKAQAKRELAEAVLDECKAANKLSEAQQAAESAAAKEKQALADEQAAIAAQQEADKAAKQQAEANQNAASQKALQESKEAEAFQREQEISLQRTQAEHLMSSQDEVSFNQGVYLLTLADSGSAKVDTLKAEAVKLSGNVQASLDVAEANRQVSQQKLSQKGQLEGDAKTHHKESKEEAELSDLAKEAAKVLKMDASERRQAAQALLANADRNSDLAEIGQQVMGGFIVTQKPAPSS